MSAAITNRSKPTPGRLKGPWPTSWSKAATNAQNQQNTGAHGGASRFKGVSWDTGKKRWRVAFRWQSKHHFVGYFTDEAEAAQVYDAAILTSTQGKAWKS